MVGPNEIRSLCEIVVKEYVAVSVIAAIPEDHFRSPIFVIISGVNQGKIVADRADGLPQEKPLRRIRPSAFTAAFNVFLPKRHGY